MKKNDIIRLVGFVLIVIGLLIAFFSYFKNMYDEKNSLIDVNKYLEETSTNEEDVIDAEIEEDNLTNESKTNPDKSILLVLEIPKINFKRGVYYKKSKYNSVKYNIQILKDSDIPSDRNGNVIIAGHNGNSKVSFFNKLNKLGLEDEIIVYYDGEKYTYKIDSIYQIEKDGQAEIYRYPDRNTITLITCSRKLRDKQEVYVAYLDSKEKY